MTQKRPVIFIVENNDELHSIKKIFKEFGFEMEYYSGWPMTYVLLCSRRCPNLVIISPEALKNPEISSQMQEMRALIKQQKRPVVIIEGSEKEIKNVMTMVASQIRAHPFKFFKLLNQ